MFRELLAPGSALINLLDVYHKSCQICQVMGFLSNKLFMNEVNDTRQNDHTEDAVVVQEENHVFVGRLWFIIIRALRWFGCVRLIK